MRRRRRLLAGTLLALLVAAAPAATLAQPAAPQDPGVTGSGQPRLPDPTGGTQQPVPPAGGAVAPAVTVRPPTPPIPPGTAAATGQEAGPATGAARAPPGTPPSEVAPPAFTARGGPDAAELELQRALQGGAIRGQVSIPDEKLGVLVQPGGRDWRVFRNHRLTWLGVASVGLPLLVLGGLYAVRGPQRIEAGRSGRRVRRYGGFERANHWMVAASFVLLALTGLQITFGVYALRPLMGAQAFAGLTWWSQAIHQFVAFPFILGILVMLAVWLRDNLPTRTDWLWIRAGGPLAKGHPPAGRFNAGQKMLYWLSMLGGIALSASGLLLLFPFAVTDVGGQQWAQVVHGVTAMLMIAVILGHIYLGTIGTEGAFEQMSRGDADWNYVREHHSTWLHDQVARAEEVAGGARRAAGAD